MSDPSAAQMILWITYSLQLWNGAQHCYCGVISPLHWLYYNKWNDFRENENIIRRRTYHAPHRGAYL